MIKLYGKDQKDPSPKVITYYHTDDGKATIGHWQKGKLYLVQINQRFDHMELVDDPDARHIAITDTDQVLILDQSDYQPNKLEQYFSNIYSDDKKSSAINIKKSGQTIVYKSSSQSDIGPGQKATRHTLEGLISATSSDEQTVILLVLRNQIILGYINNGKLDHYKTIDKGDTMNIEYHTLAFYQENKISPEILLQHSGVKSGQEMSLSSYLPHLQMLKVPSSKLNYVVEDHVELIPHYLAYSCVS